MKKYLNLFIFLLFTSCIRDGNTSNNVNIENNTNHIIKLIPYKNGVVDSLKIKAIPNYSSIQIERNNQRGKTEVPVVFWDYFKNLDSIVIIWDNTYSVTHMLSDTFFSAKKYIQFDEIRNIGLNSSYTNTSSNESKIGITWHVNYTFTEQDYLDAK
mgnify:CR=1 FL=1